MKKIINYFRAIIAIATMLCVALPHSPTTLKLMAFITTILTKQIKRLRLLIKVIITISIPTNIPERFLSPHQLHIIEPEPLIL